MALSLVHGGPAPNWLEPWIYSYMASGQEPMFLPDDHKWNEIYTKVDPFTICLIFTPLNQH